MGHQLIFVGENVGFEDDGSASRVVDMGFGVNLPADFSVADQVRRDALGDDLRADGPAGDAEDVVNQRGQRTAVQPLDDLAAEGWLSEYGLEPYEVTLEDEESGERTALLAALRLDAADGLRALGAMDNRGAYLCLSTTSDNPETTRRALEILFEDLTKEADHAGTENP